MLHGSIGLRKDNPLFILDLRSNFFSGPLPIPNSEKSVLWFVSKNNFTGEIPDSVCTMKFLIVLDLSYNSLSGKIPQCVGSLSANLNVVDLRWNKLHGTIPTTFSNGNALTSLNLNGNQLEGAIPRSLVNCTNLEILDLGNNALNDTFPEWLESLPALQVLVLRGNKLHGSIASPMSEFPLSMLRIMDLSSNDFTGALPTKYFDKLQAMQSGTENANASYMGEKSIYYKYYQDSLMVTMKGFDFELVKIRSVFTVLDFSSNSFTGEIPEIVGKLESLKGLNLSQNKLTGKIPSSLGKLTNLEWLDLSSNELVGQIPSELVDIHWLSFLNLSHNHLEGPIPHGKQFNTFTNYSYVDNLHLCGFPLSKTCRDKRSKPPPMALDQDDGDSSITNGFNWKIVMMGYASGLAIGVSVGYMLLWSNWKFSWLCEWILRKRSRF